MTDPTPAAPLSPEGLVRALRTCRGITQHEQDCISNAAKALAAANARIAALDKLYEAAFQRSVEAVAYRDEALDRAEKAEARTAEVEAERDAAIADRRRHFLAAADATERAESLERRLTRSIECTCTDTYRAITPEEHHESCPVADYALAKRQHELHVAAMQEIGLKVEDYWIASWGGFTPDEADAARMSNNYPPMLNEERALYKIVERYRALATPAQDTKDA